MSKQYNPIWTWDENTWYRFWKTVEPPWRPSKGEIRFYEKIIKKVLKNNKNPKALVLGSTPEIRDLLAEYPKIEVTVIDLNQSVYRAWTRLMKRKNPREKLIRADWLKMPLPSNYFDLVFGHCCFANIEIKKHDLFYRNIKRILKKNGCAILTHGSIEFAFKHPLTFKQVVEKYKQNPKYFKNLPNRLYILYRLASQPGVYDRRAQGVKFHILMKKLMKEAEKQGLSKKQRRDLQWMPNLDPYTYYIEVDLESFKKCRLMMRKHFKIEKEYHDTYHPIAKLLCDFVLRPKKK